MKPLRNYFPLILTSALLGAALLHGPISQDPSYHNFADQQTVSGISHFSDVISNFSFAIVALWGGISLLPTRRHPAIANAWAAYALFLAGLFLTSMGSAYYHLAPDNARLVWDRLPIALACSGLLAGVWGDTHLKDSRMTAGWLGLFAVLSVVWWHFTEEAGVGDLRPYLLLQALPIVLIPLWQWLHGSSRLERLTFGSALALYVIAKFTEIYDHEIAVSFVKVSGHTMKHLFASASAGLIITTLIKRTRTTISQ